METKSAAPIRDQEAESTKERIGAVASKEERRIGGVEVKRKREEAGRQEGSPNCKSARDERSRRVDARVESISPPNRTINKQIAVQKRGNSSCKTDRHRSPSSPRNSILST